MKYLIVFLLALSLAACKDQMKTGTAPSSSTPAQTAANSTPQASSPESGAANTSQAATGQTATGRSAGSSSPSEASGSAEGNYTVAAGDTLSGIARKHGLSQQDIVNWNNLANPNEIQVGQTLRMTAP
ncbi:MAG: LysM peptidoglycan-binding domain-containing protein [Burkholderiales bacterium]|nr:LysM peptidoglycan-binding domain-containing protein [Burkholderiales bacterium]